jgi:NAD(P)-dependent dehydrogenase (short-subunit alcohol dehydrogenase family)
MPNTSAKTVLITGGNTGIGKEVARQLALSGCFAKIYLTSRNSDKGRAAQASLETLTGYSKFEVLPLELSDLRSVETLVERIEKMDAIVMNAGGTGGPTPDALTREGVTETFASNVLGHVVLLETMLEKGLLGEVAVLAGSEAARGVPKLRFPRPKFETRSVEEFASVIDGSFFHDRKFDRMLAYGQVKYIGALWISALARKHPHLRFLTVSPGNTASTEALRDHPAIVNFLAQKVMLRLMGHPLHVGAERLVDGVLNESLVSGVFYASAGKAITGPVVDQAEVDPDFGRHYVQDNAYEAIHRFTPQ